MKALDFMTRLILIPGAIYFILAFIPEAIKDVKEWRMLFVQNNRIDKHKRTVQVYTVAPVYSNSFCTSKTKFPNIILTQK